MSAVKGCLFVSFFLAQQGKENFFLEKPNGSFGVKKKKNFDGISVISSDRYLSNRTIAQQAPGRWFESHVIHSV